MTIMNATELQVIRRVCWGGGGNSGGWCRQWPAVAEWWEVEEKRKVKVVMCWKEKEKDKMGK